MKLDGVAIIGLGYVGLPLARLIHASKIDVIGIESDTEKLSKLQLSESFMVDSDIKSVKNKKIIIVCVPTPVHSNKTPDLSILNKVLESLSRQLQNGQLIIIESTVYPGYCRNVAVAKLEGHTQLRIGRDVGLAHCPERINPGDDGWPLLKIPRVVGGFNQENGQEASAFYEQILDTQVHLMGTLEEAEAVKVVENTFRDINIAYVNEAAVTFNKLGIDLVNVINGAATKPFGFMPYYPSIGVGGHCIPIDPYYLIDAAKTAGTKNGFMTMARRINDGMPAYLANKLQGKLYDLGIARPKICVLGVTYKADIDDTRESPSLEFISILKACGHSVSVYDPYVSSLSTAGSLDEALAGCEVLVVATNHKVFSSLDFRDLARKGTVVVVDGHDDLDQDVIKAAGISYIGVGRISS